MKLHMFTKAASDNRVAINPEQVAAISEWGDNQTNIFLVGRTEVIRVEGSIDDVRSKLLDAVSEAIAAARGQRR